ncbi:ChbG/HpnK family deacetylase [Pseudoduganella aquatica]|uniref:ChbG/HpnK family deacetylase n=1 Tax=Pseudoduganella aquatica TaxID=2660641 RepID=UPI001E37994B|nr:ChbG/HpnK family deacetylase [Pseudoduganella aquatica]
MRRLIINADDIGMHPAIDQGVAALAEQGVVTSASIMALGRPDRDALATLRRYGVNLGLHLDFTSAMAHARYGHRRGVGATIAATWARRMPPQQARTVVLGQLHRFGELTGAMPAFIDGHEHVHQFPVIREALMEVLAAGGGHAAVFLRDTRPRRWRGAKAALIGALGAAELARQARRLGLRSNGDFLGVYDLSGQADLPALWRGWLASIAPAGALAMCHPAAAHPALEQFRRREFRFLGSTQFADMLAEFQVQPACWEDTPRHFPVGG